MHKTLLRLWLVIWVITLPLIHIHPDADHAHGMSDHVHGGTYHSILVNTPVHAHQYHEQHHHDDFFPPGDGFGSSHSPSPPLHGIEEATYGFSVIKPSIVLESEKSQLSHDVVVADFVEPLSQTGASKPNFIPKKKLVSLLPKILSPRAPPVLSI